ncbi:PRC-barrel domain-containing protein [Sphingomonas sabuli]|uniref:PRC-barrel domain-containing protein n=1 Tax=Sphingomonas sabuli TaxID=2764186 RepID=A0A7G9L3Q3_9SPHN|nr:PRC-barrel domain-containing protein [Sphingomonas sabuli]QNM83252.1 PRC-barrel domain-containing protein [Sphingomonas sabuli]
MQQIASIVAPLATTIAALIVASNLGARITGAGFIIFTVGSIGWCLLGYATGQDNLLWQNIILTGLNLFGVWRWLGWQRRIEEGGAKAAKDSKGEPSETLFPVSLLTKAKIVTKDGEDLGKAVDAMAGCGSGRIAYLVVAEGGVAGVGETLRRLPWTGCMAGEDGVTAPVARQDFCKLEALEPDNWPAR